MADWLEAFVPLRIHVLVRFGRWDELIAAAAARRSRPVLHAPRPPSTTAAASRTPLRGSWLQARAERDAFAAGLCPHPGEPLSVQQHQPRHPGRRREPCSTVKSTTAKGNSTTRSPTCGAPSNSTTRCPTTSRGAGCSRPGTPTARCCSSRAASTQAAEVYAADLGLDPTLSRPCQHPGNVWSLHGYHECLQRLGRDAEAAIIGQQLDLAAGARRRADPCVVRLPARCRRRLTLTAEHLSSSTVNSAVSALREARAADVRRGSVCCSFTTIMQQHQSLPGTCGRCCRRSRQTCTTWPRDPIRVLIQSLLWIDGKYWWPYLIVFTLFLAPAERWLGQLRWLLSRARLPRRSAPYLERGISVLENPGGGVLAAVDRRARHRGELLRRRHRRSAHLPHCPDGGDGSTSPRRWSSVGVIAGRRTRLHPAAATSVALLYRAGVLSR